VPCTVPPSKQSRLYIIGGWDLLYGIQINLHRTSHIGPPVALRALEMTIDVSSVLLLCFKFRVSLLYKRGPWLEA